MQGTPCEPRRRRDRMSSTPVKPESKTMMKSNKSRDIEHRHHRNDDHRDKQRHATEQTRGEERPESSKRRNRRLFSQRRNDMSMMSASMVSQSPHQPQDRRHSSVSVSRSQINGQPLRRLTKEEKALRDLKTFPREKLAQILQNAKQHLVEQEVAMTVLRRKLHNFRGNCEQLASRREQVLLEQR